MSSRALSRALVALAVFPAVLAAQPAPNDAAVVVSASRTEQRLRDAIPHTTVITRQDIRDSQAVDLPSLLGREAGLEFTQSGGVGSNSSLFMRGGRSAQTLVLIDGVRVEDAAFGTTAIQHIMLDEVERVEIVRGNVSSLYGSGAIGGVVEVFTRRGSGTPGPSVEASAGSRGTWKLRGGYGGQTGDTRFNVSASRFDTRGFSAIDTQAAPGANPDPDGYRNDSVSGNIAQRLSAAQEVGVAFFRSRGRLDYDNAFGAPTDINQSAQDLGMAQVFWEAKFIERWKSRVTLAEGTDYRTDLLNGAFNNSSNTRNRQVIWDNQVRLAPAHEISIGLEELDQELKNSGLLPQERARRADIARLGYLGRVGNHSLQLNGRTEHYTDFGTANTYFAGYGYDVTEQWRLLASTSTAFRAPTFIDLYGFGGNPALKPERARTNELGVQWASGTDRVRVSYFETRYQDAITFDLQTFTVRNVRKASVNGIESSYSGNILGIDFRAAFTVQDATEQEPDGQELPAIRRARRYGSLAAYRSFGALRVGAELNGSGRRPDNDIATFSRIQEAGYTVVNFTARYDYSKHVYVAAKLTNAFDEKYQLVNGFNTPRLGMLVTVGWQP
jgi:vitamin B12 transporter